MELCGEGVVHKCDGVVVGAVGAHLAVDGGSLWVRKAPLQG